MVKDCKVPLCCQMSSAVFLPAPWLQQSVSCPSAGAEHVLQPSTVLAGAALLLLVFNLLRSAWQQRRSLAGNMRQLTAGEAQTVALAGQATAQLQARVEDRVMAAAAWVAPRVGAVAGIIQQQLSGAHNYWCGWRG